MVGDSSAVLRTLNSTLGAWGTASVVGGSLLAAAGRGRGIAAFGQQSAQWGAINALIAGVGAWRARTSAPNPSRLRTVLLVNAALDVGYIAVGIAMARGTLTFGGRIVPQTALGHGSAVVVQGAGLLVIDTAAAAALTFGN